MAKKLTAKVRAAKVRAAVKNKKFIRTGYLMGFLEALRLMLGMPAGITYRKTWTYRQRLALKAFEPQFASSVKRSVNGATQNEYADKRTGAPPDEKFLKRVKAA
jgi:hypothetical protein